MTMTREILERSRPAAGGDLNAAGADRLRQDGIMSKPASPSNGTAALAGPAMRRPERFPVQFSIEVCGFDRCGRFFTERSETCNVSDGGCKFYLRTEVDREAIVALRVIERYDPRGNNSAPVLFQVGRIERESSGWALGALKLHAEEPWPVQSLRARHGAPSFD
jgi:hypothetical protein